MASAFKQQCPSCEAMVPIRDRGLIGRKIDCPTCKYRFVVDEPADETEDEAPQPASRKGKPDAARAGGPAAKGAATKTRPTGRRRDQDDDEDQPRKGGDGGSTKLAVGLLAGVVGVGLIGVAVYFGFFHDSGSTRPSAPSSGPTTPPTTPPGGTATTTPPTTVPGVATTGDPTQPGTPQAATPGELYGEITNLLPNDSEGIIHVPFQAVYRSSLRRMSIDEPGVFSSKEFEMRTGIRLDDVVRVVQAISFSKNWTFHVLKTEKPIVFSEVQRLLQLKEPAQGGGKDYWITTSSGWVDSLLRHQAAFAPAKLGPLAVRQHDQYTLVFGDEEPMRAFVAANGKFTLQHKGPFQPMPGAPGTGQDQAGTTPGTPAPPAPPSDIATGGGGSVGTIDLNRPPPGMATSPDGQPAVRPYYATVKSQLKAMLDRLEVPPALVSMAFDTRASRGRLDKFIPTFIHLTTLAGFTTRQIDSASVLGLAVHAVRNGFNFSAFLDCADVDASRSVRRGVQEGGTKLAKLLETVLGVKANVVTDQQDSEPGGGTGASGGGTTGQPPAGPRIGVGGGGGGTELGVGGGGGTPTIGGVGTGRPAQPGQPEAGPADSTIEVKREERLVTLRVNLALPDAAHGKFSTVVQQYVRQLRGEQDMSANQARWHEVGKATTDEVAKKNSAYPRGTFHREPGSARASIPYPPSQRVSWMASLLPHLGYDVRFNPQKSWQDPENLPTAGVLVPQFLDPRSPRGSWWVRQPGMTQDVAATHIVGMAGLGADAAEYTLDDPNTKAKLGVFGYDRITKLTDIPDGAAHTIMMIQVPPTFKRPWMAGGGATVMGVPDAPPSQKSVTPFVSTEYGGRKGTMAIMADGSVRFIAADVPDDLFKAMCTTQGGDQKFLDRDVPMVKAPETTAALRADAPAPKPAAGGGPTGEWKEFVSKEGSFSVLMPATPTPSKQTNKLPTGGEIHIHVFMALNASEGTNYIASYTDYPPELTDQPAEALLNMSIAGLKANPQFKLLEEKPISLGNTPGREVVVDTGAMNQTVMLRQRVYATKGRVYVLNVSGNKQGLSAAGAVRFLDSFKLLGQ